MPGPGGLLDQDPYWVNAFTLYYNVRGEKERLDRVRQEAKAKRAGRK